jgi:hypothetical protein
MWQVGREKYDMHLLNAPVRKWCCFQVLTSDAECNVSSDAPSVLYDLKKQTILTHTAITRHAVPSLHILMCECNSVHSRQTSVCTHSQTASILVL